MENLDPNNPPVEDGSQEGQPVEQTEPTPEIDPVETRLAELEKQNKNLQYRLTQQGRERKQAQAQPEPETVAEDFDWNNPGASIKKEVVGALGDFEARQERRRRSDEMKRMVTKEYGIPDDDYDVYYRQLEEAAASGDPLELHRTVARMYRADHTEQAISEAKRVATETVTRNARAVTTEGGTPSQPEVPGDVPSGFRDWPADKRREYLSKTLGVNEFGA